MTNPFYQSLLLLWPLLSIFYQFIEHKFESHYEQNVSGFEETLFFEESRLQNCLDGGVFYRLAAHMFTILIACSVVKLIHFWELGIQTILLYMEDCTLKETSGQG